MSAPTIPSPQAPARTPEGSLTPSKAAPNPDASSRVLPQRTRRRSSAISRRRVRALVAIGQSWQHLETGELRVVRQIWRKDGLVLMVGPDGELRTPTFGELGRSYRLISERA